MARAGKLMRRTIHTFLQSYHHFFPIASLLVLPASASLLFSQSLAPASPAVDTIQSHIHSLFDAAGFPASAEFFALLNLKFSQTIFSLAFTLPFALTTLVLAKASVVHVVCRSTNWRRAEPTFLKSSLRLYCPILQTHVCNCFAVLSINATVFSVLFAVFNAANMLGCNSSNTILLLSAASAILYSIVLAHVLVACNLAVIISGVENCSGGGLLPLFKAAMLIRGRAATALSLSLPANLGMAAIEALFQYRVVRVLHASNGLRASIVSEAFSIACIHSLLLVVDIIATCEFYKSCARDDDDDGDAEVGLLRQENPKGASGRFP